MNLPVISCHKRSDKGIKFGYPESTSNLKFLKLNFPKNQFLLTSLFVKGTLVLSGSKHESSCLIPHPPPTYLIKHHLVCFSPQHFFATFCCFFSHCFISNLVLTSHLAPYLAHLPDRLLPDNLSGRWLQLWVCALPSSGHYSFFFFF